MNRMIRHWTPMGSLMLLALLSCVENPETPVLYDPSAPGGPTPEIVSISPSGQAFAGIDTITVTGTNFSTTPGENIVYVNSTVVPLATATATTLTFKAPNIVLDSVGVRVARFGSEKMSSVVKYKLVAAYLVSPSIPASEEAWAAATDSAGNLYLSMTSGGGIGIKKYPAAGGPRTDYSTTGGVTKFTGMKMGPGGEIYAARNLGALYKVPAGGGTPAAWLIGGGLGRTFDFDFDVNKNIWAAGDGANVYRVRPDKNVKAFALDANIRSVRVYNGYVYFAGKLRSDNSEQVVRRRIVTADSLDVTEGYFNFSSSPFFTSGRSIYAITFSADGHLYVSTDAENPIIVVTPTLNAYSLYPGVLTPTHHVLAWGTGPFLYALRGNAAAGAAVTSPTVMKINTLRLSAPYHGRQ